MPIKSRLIGVMIICILACSGCKVFSPNIMFKTKDYPISNDEPQLKKTQYMIAPGDKIKISVFSNDGYVLVDVGVTGEMGPLVSQGQVEYLILENGFVRLPILDTVFMKGFTIKEAEHMLEKKYATYFKNPYIILNVVNRRVYVFMGSEKASVIPISDENTTLIEVLARAGGIPGSNKAYKIKIIRGDMKNPLVKYIDLSTIDGLKSANLDIQANDIIYIEPFYNVPSEVVSEIAPFISLLTSLLFVIIVFNQGQ